MKYIIINAKNKSLGNLIKFLIKIISIKKIKNFNKNIIIMNVKHTKYTELKLKKIYFKHSNYPGGLKKFTLKNLIKKNYKNFLIKLIKNNSPKNNNIYNLNKKIKIIKENSKIFNKNKPKILINDKLSI